MSLKASLKSVIAEMDSFGAVKKRESHHLFSLLSRGIWELHRDIYGENPLWTKPPLISEKERGRTGTEKKKKKNSRPVMHPCYFRFLQKLRVTKEDGWQTEILDLFIHPTGGNIQFSEESSHHKENKKNHRTFGINVTLWVRHNTSQITSFSFNFIIHLCRHNNRSLRTAELNKNKLRRDWKWKWMQHQNLASAPLGERFASCCCCMLGQETWAQHLGLSLRRAQNGPVSTLCGHCLQGALVQQCKSLNRASPGCRKKIISEYAVVQPETERFCTVSSLCLWCF